MNYGHYKQPQWPEYNWSLGDVIEALISAEEDILLGINSIVHLKDYKTFFNSRTQHFYTILVLNARKTCQCVSDSRYLTESSIPVLYKREVRTETWPSDSFYVCVWTPDKTVEVTDGRGDINGFWRGSLWCN